MRDFWGEDFPPSWNPLTAVVWFLLKFYGVFSHSLVFFLPDSALLTSIVMIPAGIRQVGHTRASPISAVAQPPTDRA
jgi:hypothetical protein